MYRNRVETLSARNEGKVGVNHSILSHETIKKIKILHRYDCFIFVYEQWFHLCDHMLFKSCIYDHTIV